MDGSGFIPNDNQSVIRMLSGEYGRHNRGRNRILLCAVALCIVTLTMVFGITTGKVRAEYTKGGGNHGVRRDRRSGRSAVSEGAVAWVCEAGGKKSLCGMGVCGRICRRR